jgi:hypothetical protein
MSVQFPFKRSSRFHTVDTRASPRSTLVESQLQIKTCGATEWVPRKGSVLKVRQEAEGPDWDMLDSRSKV